MTLLINSIASPLQIGVYTDDRLDSIQTIEGKVSDILLPALEKILPKGGIEKIIYTSGPGSYMSIKLTYIALKTIETIKGIPFEACSAFALCDDRPVRAMGKLYFVKEKETIITQKFDQEVKQEFGMPEYLGTLEIEPENTPLYIIPAV